MNDRSLFVGFLTLLAAAAVFIVASSFLMPAHVASHFGPSGAPDGFMPRSVYVGILLAVGLGSAALVGLLPRMLMRGDPGRINLPHRDYWLAPERREATFAFLRSRGLVFGMAVAVFLAYVHWLVVEANATQPPELSGRGIAVALAAFVVFTGLWVRGLFVRFRRPG